MTSELSDALRHDLQELNRRLGDRVPLVLGSRKPPLETSPIEELRYTPVVLTDGYTPRVGLITSINDEPAERVFTVDTGFGLERHSWVSLRATTETELRASVTGVNPSTVWGENPPESSPTADRPSPLESGAADYETRIVDPTLNGEPVPEIILTLLDGSVFIIDSPIAAKAVLVGAGDQFETVIEKLQYRIAERFDTEQTKPSTAEPGNGPVIRQMDRDDDAPVETHADIAYSVIYDAFRSRIMATTLAAIQTRTDPDEELESNDMTVVGLGEDITYYTGDGSITVPAPDEE